MTRPKRFRGMELTEEEVEGRLRSYRERTHELMHKYPDGIRYAFTISGTVRAQRLLPLWRKWAIERERLWFALIGLGLDIESDERDMPRAEMRMRIGLARSGLRGYLVRYVLEEIDR